MNKLNRSQLSFIQESDGHEFAYKDVIAMIDYKTMSLIVDDDTYEKITVDNFNEVVKGVNTSIFGVSDLNQILKQEGEL